MPAHPIGRTPRSIEASGGWAGPPSAQPRPAASPRPAHPLLTPAPARCADCTAHGRGGAERRHPHACYAFGWLSFLGAPRSAPVCPRSNDVDADSNGPTRRRSCNAALHAHYCERHVAPICSELASSSDTWPLPRVHTRHTLKSGCHARALYVTRCTHALQTPDRHQTRPRLDRSLTARQYE